MAASWDEACEEELQLSQETEAQIMDAENQRTQSTSGGVCSEDDEPDICRPSRWWAGILKVASASTGRGQTVPPTGPTKELVVVSACTGCSAECFVFKAGSCPSPSRSRSPSHSHSFGDPSPRVRVLPG